MSGSWKSMESAPKDGTLIIGMCLHSANNYYEEDGERLTAYGSHCEGLSHVIDGPHIIQWGGEYIEKDYETGIEIYIPDYWFRHGSDFEEVANPVMWCPTPK